MAWYFIGVYIINRTLHGRLEIRNFSSRVALEEKFRISAQPCNIFYLLGKKSSKIETAVTEAYTVTLSLSCNVSVFFFHLYQNGC